jgi:SAM-dependent methyltransferase
VSRLIPTTRETYAAAARAAALQQRNGRGLESRRMPVPEDMTASPAGPAPAPADVDIAALYDRLRREIRRTGTTRRDGDGRHDARAAVRGFAERYWAVTAERPIERRPGLKGALAYPLKKLLRPFLRWYVEPFAYEQRMFNDAALKLVDALYEEVERGDRADAELSQRIEQGHFELSERVDAVEGRLERKVAETGYALSERLDRTGADQEQARRLLDEVEERLTRTERRADAGVPRTVAPQPAAAAFPDYFAFESKLRGRAESVKERQRVYVDDLRDAAPVLDVGCGRGELLALLRDEGVEARGVDPDGDMVAFARGEGLDVEQADAVSCLDSLDDGSLGGIFMGQVVEHLPAPMLVRTLELAARKLRPGGVLVAETINPLSPLALRNYFADLTHAQPLVPDTLVLLARQAGFVSVETRFLNPPPRPEGVSDGVAEILFAPLDYAIVARTRP